MDSCFNDWATKKGKKWQERKKGISSISKYDTEEGYFNFLNIRASKLQNRTIQSIGLEMYVPFANILPNVKDFFAISEPSILESEINNMVNNPLRCNLDYYMTNINLSGSNDIKKDLFDAYYNTYCLARRSPDEGGYCDPLTRIIAFRFVYRLYNNTYDLELYNKLVNKVLNIYPLYNFQVLVNTNIFSSNITILVSNVTVNPEIIQAYLLDSNYNRYDRLLSRHLSTNFRYIKNALDSIYAKYLDSKGIKYIL